MSLLSIFLVEACSFTLARSQAMSPAASGPSSAPSSDVSAPELSRLRPIVMPDLKKLAATVDNENETDLDAAYIESLFQQCRFTRLTLGSLGPAILVESDLGGGMGNFGMLNIYLPAHSSYRRILAEQGFGPKFLSAPGPVPDFVFGWAEGVCHATYSHYHYQNGSYISNACNREVEGKGDNCAIKTCKGSKLPTVPNPWSSS
jgi:hypothetical protein